MEGLQETVGKYVIVRSYSEGVNAGFVDEVDETGVVLRQARRLHYHEPADKDLSWYEGVSISGLSEDSRVSPAVEKKYILEDYSITLCSDIAAENIQNFKVHPCTA